MSITKWVPVQLLLLKDPQLALLLILCLLFLVEVLRQFDRSAVDPKRTTHIYRITYSKADIAIIIINFFS